MIAHKLEKQCVFIEHALNADLYYMTFSSDNNHRLILTVVKKNNFPVFIQTKTFVMLATFLRLSVASLPCTLG